MAAPWAYLFCTKIHRLSGSGISTVQPYDQDDAVHYLERYLSQHSTASVTQVTLRAWFAQYLLCGQQKQKCYFRQLTQHTRSHSMPSRIQSTSTIEFSSPFHHGFDNCIRHLQCRVWRTGNSVDPYRGCNCRHSLQVVAKVKVFLFRLMSMIL